MPVNSAGIPVESRDTIMTAIPMTPEEAQKIRRGPDVPSHRQAPITVHLI